MDNGWILELVGYAASVLIAVSLMMRSVLRLRMINLAGSSCFVVYGLLIQAFPVVIMNCVIIIINVYHLRKMARTKTYFSILESRSDSEYLMSFLEFHSKEIAEIFPDFRLRQTDDPIVWFILQGLVPVGVFIAEVRNGGELFAHLDYVIPGYRDLRPGRFLYTKQRDRFAGLGVTRVCSAPGCARQRKYLRRMGFAPAHGGDTTLCRPV